MKALFCMTVAAAALLAGGAQAQLVIEKGSDDRINWQSLEDFAAAHSDIRGQSVTILAPWLGADQELFTSITAYFEDATGATVNYSGSNSFEQQIVIDSEAGSPPDIAVLPQPGLAVLIDGLRRYPCRPQAEQRT